MKQLARRLLLGKEIIPEYAVVGVRDPVDPVTVLLKVAGRSFDVSDRTVGASLSPFRIAIGLENVTAEATSVYDFKLVFLERAQPNSPLGSIELKFVEMLELGSGRLGVFQATRSRNECVSAWKWNAYFAYRWLNARRRRRKYNHQLSRHDLHAFYVFYTRPRPVALITVSTPRGNNIFPMDLIGPTNGQSFTLALHNTSPVLGGIEHTRKLAVSYVPYELADVVYELGKNHRTETTDWSTVPLTMEHTARYGLPVPQQALASFEVDIDELRDMGSHTLLIGRPARARTDVEGRYMCHVQGYYQSYLKHQHRAL